jgi:hypothetical protein
MRPVHRGSTRILALLLVSVSVSVGSLTALHSPARAQSDEDRAAARAAATEGAKAMADHRYADAVDLFSRAESLLHAPTHLLYIARALAAQGKLVRAQETYLKIGRDTLAPNAPKAFKDAQADAAKELGELEPRVPYVKVVVDGATRSTKPGAAEPGANVTMDGAPLSSALIGLSRPIDPGAHTLRADAPGMASDDVTVTLKEGARETVTLTLKPLAAAQVAPPPQVPATPPSEHAQASGRGMRTAGLVAIGVGVVGAAAGTFFLVQNRSKRGEADDLCANGVCPRAKQGDVQSLDSDADSAATFAWIGYAVAGVAAAAGVTLLVLDAKQAKREESARVHVTPWIGLHGAGLSGTFE